MQKIEKNSGFTVSALMKKAGALIAEKLEQETSADQNILILAGKGNNGGDGFTAARLLKDRKYRIYLAEGIPAGREALSAYKRISPECLVSEHGLKKAIQEADVIVDAVYGIGYHGSLDESMKKLFQAVNASDAYVISIDINSGCESDTGHCDRNAVHSDVTWALDCWKPFHLLAKVHHQFLKKELLNGSASFRIRSLS